MYNKDMKNLINNKKIVYVTILSVMITALILIFIGLFLKQSVEYNVMFYYQSSVDDIMNHTYYQYNETFQQSYSLFEGDSGINYDLYAWYNNNTLMFIYDNVYLQSYTLTYKIYLSYSESTGASDQLIIFSPILTSFTKLIDDFSISDDMFLANKILLFIGMILFFIAVTFIMIINYINKSNKKEAIDKEKGNV